MNTFRLGGVNSNKMKCFNEEITNMTWSNFNGESFDQ